VRAHLSWLLVDCIRCAKEVLDIFCNQTLPHGGPSSLPHIYEYDYIYHCFLAGLRWSERSSYCQYIPDPELQPPYDPRTTYKDYNCLLPIEHVYGVLIVQWVVYFLLSIYLSNVLKNEVGTRRSVWYPLTLSYWVPRPAAKAAALQAVLAETKEHETAAGRGDGAGVSGRSGLGLGRRSPGRGRGPGVEPLEEDVNAEEHKMREWRLQQTGKVAGCLCGCVRDQRGGH
jgi:hypothetical protein